MHRVTSDPNLLRFFYTLMYTSQNTVMLHCLELSLNVTTMNGSDLIYWNIQRKDV